MDAKMIVKIVMLCLMAVCVLIAIVSKFLISGKNTERGTYYIRRVMRVRLICFVAMLVCLLVCFLI